MNLIRAAIHYPVSTAVGVILVVLFGTVSLFGLPVQLTPDVDKPVISIISVWPGASPHEIERDLVDEQEEQLKSLEGLMKMESTSRDGVGVVTLTFRIGTNKDAALLRVSNRLEQVRDYPQDAEKPVLRASNLEASAVAWMNLAPAPQGGFEGDITTLQDFAEDVIKPALERVPGVSTANVYGGRKRELQVIVDPARLAARQVTISDLGAALERENRNYSGGDFDEGKRRYRVRTLGEYASPEEVEVIVIAVRNGVPIYLRDVARAQIGYRKADDRTFSLRGPSLAINIIKDTGANVMEVMAGVKETVRSLNREALRERGLALEIDWDQTLFIRDAIRLVTSSLVIGSVLAVGVLLLFLRSVTSTLVIAVSIPVSLIGTFILMAWMGRTINVVSLAGLAFASGMVVDNSIVVLENIYRHRQTGKSRMAAALEGAMEVWGAVLASTLTTIAVFVPVVFIQEEVGQLFGDIAVAIATAVGLSLVVSITVIPSLSARILHAADSDDARPGFHSLWGGVERAARWRDWVKERVGRILQSRARRWGMVGAFTAASLLLSWALLPKTEYLPAGNQNFLFGVILPPPGHSIDEISSLDGVFKRDLGHLWKHEAGSREARALPGGGVQDYFFGTWEGFAFMGVSANDKERVRELLPEFRKTNASVPGSIVLIDQASIFGGDEGSSRNIDIDISGPDLERLIELGTEVFMKIGEALPGAQALPIPSLDLGNPEVHVRIHRQRAAELGISNRDLGFAVSALVDGAKASDYKSEGKEIDLKVMAELGDSHRTHLLEQMPIAAPGGQLVTLGSVAEVVQASGPTQINRRERQRTITIRVTPAQTMPLGAAMETLQEKVLGPMRQDGRLGGLYQVALTGSADKLTRAAAALWWNFLLAMLITYLLMAALFESFLHPLVIMFSVPLGAVGGFLGLAATNLLITYQPLDVITMLGFIILVGTVVNNAILIVHQSLNHMRDEAMEPAAAIVEATGSRIRPIFMTVGTTSLGMLPLILFPGAGSELYRGLGSVVVGGLVVSTLFTLFLIPAAFSLALDLRDSVRAGARAQLKALAGRLANGRAAGGSR
jgi:HAE1 family hydrophobic/amphiphilic exporter-1